MIRCAIWMCALVATSCAARAGFGLASEPSAPMLVSSGESAPSPVAEPSQEEAPAPSTSNVDVEHGGYAPGEDQHWFQADDYLVSAKPYKNERLGLRVGKMIDAGTNPKGEAHFLMSDGTQLWAATYYKSRIATRADLKVGALAFCFSEGFSTKDWPMTNKARVRQAEWTLAPVTEVGDLQRGHVSVGNATCTVGRIRVPAR